ETAGIGVASHNTRTAAFSRAVLNVLAFAWPVTSTSSPTLRGCGFANCTATPPVESCTKREGEVRMTLPRTVAIGWVANEARRRLLIGCVFRLAGRASS